MREFFVSFSHQDGFGNTKVTIDGKVTEKTILQMAKVIERDMQCKSVVILYWREYEELSEE